MGSRYTRRYRQSTRDRFRSILRGESLEDTYSPWYKKRRNYLTLFILIVFFAVTAALSAMYKNHFFDEVSESNESVIQQADAQAASATPDNATPSESMEYDEAKRLFGGEP